MQVEVGFWVLSIDAINVVDMVRTSVFCTTLTVSRKARQKRIRITYCQSKDLAKLGNIVAKTLLRMQMFPNLAARKTCVAETNFVARKTKNVFAWSQKHFCFPDTNLASETYVSQFSHTGKHNKRHCFRNNVS